jgi:SAM-dependent methyltransferase
MAQALKGKEAPSADGVDLSMASEAERIIGLYERHAADWDENRGRSLFEKPWLDRFLDHLPQSASILDIGCGSAEPIARYLIERGCQVTGIDSSPALIGMCKNRFPDQDWIVADRGLRGVKPSSYLFVGFAMSNVVL